MASRKYDSFKDLRQGKYDWKVQARVLNIWRGYTIRREPFKSCNLLLLDSKRARIHAFVPGNIADQVEKVMQVGSVYLIENFTVKAYTTEDNFRCIRKDIQIVFGADTQIKPLEESKVSIEKYGFDFFDLAELSPLANQKKFLIDVIGVMEKPKPLAKLKNRLGQIQSQMKFKITDGSTTVKVTFWDEFAELFSETIKSNDLEYPLILIIGSGRVTKWADEVDIANVGATTFYLNIKHHTVTQMRRLLSNPSFAKNKLFKQNNRIPKLYKVKDIKNLSEDHIESEVLCQVQLRMLENMQTWFVPVCNSCYNHAEMVGQIYRCIDCQRKGSYPDKKFQICILASDGTDEIKIMLEDREVRTLIGKTVFYLIDQGNNEERIPDLLKAMENKYCTVKLLISKENIEKQAEIYLARDIMEGFNMDGGKNNEQESNPHPISHMEPQPSGSSYHLDSLSEISYPVGEE